MTTYLVTGATGGIGLEFCRQLCDRQETVIAVCRHSSPELEQLGVRVESGCDITSAEAVSKLASNLTKCCGIPLPRLQGGDE
nr:SDR family NAD(P)-dependent oxidoreductase [Arthrospira sp. SH-MAG29]